MSETKTTYLLWSMLTGTISFFASAVITSMVLLPLDFAIIDTILAGGIGGLFLGLFHMNHHKIQKMGLAGLVAVPIGFWGAFILAGGADLLFSAVVFPQFSGISSITSHRIPISHRCYCSRFFNFSLQTFFPILIVIDRLCFECKVCLNRFIV